MSERSESFATDQDDRGERKDAESSGERGTRGRSRREVIGAAAAAVPAAVLAGREAQARAADALLRRAQRQRAAGMNLIIYITDQDRAIQHFPRGWARRNLPGQTRLERHGLSFTNAFTNSCMCSPARSTLFTGYYPAQHRVKYTLEQDMPSPQYPQNELPTGLPNIATVMSAAGYDVIYKGKWHMSKPQNGESFTPADLAAYGFSRWNPPDAGANQNIPEAGGGWPDNDGRFMNDDGPMVDGKEGVHAYLRSQAGADQPFCLIVSLVNPHDVLFYPNTYQEAEYLDPDWLKGEIGLPETIDEDLRTKPRVQRQFRRIFDLTGKLDTRRKQREYLNFYGNLIKASDAYLNAMLDTLEETGLREDTIVVRTADHGEMGLAHGGLRQKNFNFYEETLRVPMVFSNPKLFPRARRSRALVSHVDFLPTLAGLFEAPRSARRNWPGADYSALVLDPSKRGRRDHILFTYDDFQSGQRRGPYPRPPNHIVSIRERRYKLAKYYDVEGRRKAEWEMYDLKRDPLERDNLARRGYKKTRRERRQLRRLRKRLRRARKRKLRPLS